MHGDPAAVDRGGTVRLRRHLHHLTGAFGNPKPVQRPHPPILIGGRSAATLRVVAEHADLWNIPGGDIDDAVRRSALLDRYCAEIGRDPASITRSIDLPVSYDQPGSTRDAIGEASTPASGTSSSAAGALPADVARWVADEPALRPSLSNTAPLLAPPLCPRPPICLAPGSRRGRGASACGRPFSHSPTHGY